MNPRQGRHEAMLVADYGSEACSLNLAGSASLKAMPILPSMSGFDRLCSRPSDSPNRQEHPISQLAWPVILSHERSQTRGQKR
jgi:hypothetical protein